MAQNEKLTNRLRLALKDIPQVKEKTMFRGIAFLINDKLCMSVGDNELMCRIDPILHEKAIAKKGCRSVIMKGKVYKGYVYIHEDVLTTKEDWDYWIELALDFNKRAKASKKTKTK